MKAVVYTGYGSADVLQCVDVEKPAPKDDQILIKVRASSVNAPDWRIMSGNPSVMRLMFGLRKPRIRPGMDVAGRIEAVGKNITQFKPGDEVFGCAKGSFAEYACSRESALAIKPETVTFEQAACVGVCGLTALQGLRDKGNIQPGQRVLINGASGGVGTFAVQVAKALGADVTAVCSAANLEQARALGADRVIDYNQEDFTKQAQRYDIIFDCVGSHPASEYRAVLNPTGICVMAGVPHNMKMMGLIKHMMLPLVLSRVAKQKFRPFMAKISKADLSILAGLMETGKLTPAIDRRYPLSETAEALRYVDTGHARAKVVITVP